MLMVAAEGFSKLDLSNASLLMEVESKKHSLDFVVSPALSQKATVQVLLDGRILTVTTTTSSLVVQMNKYPAY